MPCRILVVDDSATIQKVIKIAFSRLDAEVVSAGSFVEALNEVSSNRFDVLVLDAGLAPGRSLQELQKLARESPQTPVLLLMGSYDGIDEGQLRAAGFKFFLKKPFEAADIVRLVTQILGRPITEVQSAPPPVRRSDDLVVTATNLMPPPPPPGLSNPNAPSVPVFSLGSAEDDTEVLSASSISGFEQANLPPLPLTEEGRRGQRAFSGEAVEGSKGRPFDLPPIPGGEVTAMRSFGDSGQSLPLAADPSPTFDINPSVPADLTGRTFKEPEPFTFAMSSPTSTGGRSSASAASSPLGAGPAPTVDAELVREIVMEMLPSMVRQAVDEYCAKHFSVLAREVLTAELRRLADEKTRHLVE